MSKYSITIVILFLYSSVVAYGFHQVKPSELTEGDLRFYTSINSDDEHSYHEVDSLIHSKSTEADSIIAKYAYFSDGALAESMPILIDKAIRSRKGFVDNISETKYFEGVVNHLYFFIIDEFSETDEAQCYDLNRFTQMIEKYLLEITGAITDKENELLRASLWECHRYFTTDGNNNQR